MSRRANKLSRREVFVGGTRGQLRGRGAPGLAVPVGNPEKRRQLALLLAKGGATPALRGEAPRGVRSPQGGAPSASGGQP